MRGCLRTRAAVGLALAAAVVAKPVKAGRDEYEVKAAFLLNFARLVEWPAAARPADDAPLVVAVLGSEALADAFAKVIGDTQVGSHRVTVRHISSPEQVAGCHILFVGRGDVAGLGAVLEAARAHAILSVGESEGFATRGGIVNFFTDGSRLRFEINAEAAKRAGLGLSSRLLGLAVIVRSES